VERPAVSGLHQASQGASRAATVASGVLSQPELLVAAGEGAILRASGDRTANDERRRLVTTDGLNWGQKNDSEHPAEPQETTAAPPLAGERDRLRDGPARAAIGSMR
jgi:hypothetical protein